MTQAIDKSQIHFSDVKNPFTGVRLFDENGETNARGAANYLGIGEGQVHQMLKAGRFVDAHKVDEKWRISKDALDLYDSTKGQRSPSGNAAAGRVKVFGWVTDAELKALNEAGYNFRQKATKGSTNGKPATDNADDNDGE